MLVGRILKHPSFEQGTKCREQVAIQNELQTTLAEDAWLLSELFTVDYWGKTVVSVG